MKNTNIFIRLFSGFKKGYTTPNLPENIIAFQNYPIIRILRFLGGVSLLFILSKSYLGLPLIFLCFACFFTFLFSVYHFVVSYYRIKHMIKILKSDALNVKISNLNQKDRKL